MRPSFTPDPPIIATFLSRANLRRPGFTASTHPHLLTFCIVLLTILCLPAVSTGDVRLSTSITAGYTYTDNVFLEPEDEEHDLITTISPGAELSITGRYAGAAVAYSPTYASYSRFPENTTWRHDASVDGWADIARGARLELTNAFLRTEDPILETDTTVRQGREPYYTNTTTVGLINQFGAEDTVELRYEYYILENEDDTVEDSSYQRPSLLLTYWLSPNRYAMEVEGTYTVSDFDVSENFEELGARLRFTRRFGRHLDVYVEYIHEYFDYLSEGEDYQVYNPIIGFIWAEQANTLLSSSFGYFYRDNENQDDDDGIVGDVELVYTYAADNAFTFGGSVGYDRSSFDADNLGFSTFYEFRGSVTHRLMRRLTATVDASYRDDAFIDETPNREDITRTVGAGVTFQVLPWMLFDLEYEHRQVDSTEDADDYTENRGSIFVRLAPPQPIRF